MAGIKISALPASPSALLTDILPIVQGGITYKETLTQILTLFSSSLAGTFVPLAGGIMTGPLILNADATQPLQAVTYEQLQTVAAGFTVILACDVATTGNLNVIQAGAGVGATLTDNSGTFAAFSTDGVSPALNSRILVKDQTLTQHNGVYILTTNGDGLAIPYVLTRATDYDQAPAEVKPGTLIAINQGTLNATTSWLETATVAIMDTDPILFSQFTFSPTSFLLKANNLSDLTNVPAALVNLGLGIPTGTGNVVLQTSPTLITPTLGAASATSLTFNPTTSGIIGTPTNDNAAVGIVGQFISSEILFAARAAIANNTPKNITSISIPAGDWEIWGASGFSFSGSHTQVISWVSTTSATLPDPAYSAINSYGASTLPNEMINAPRRRFSVAAPTTIYLGGYTTFSTGACSAYGTIYARRMR